MLVTILSVAPLRKHHVLNIAGRFLSPIPPYQLLGMRLLSRPGVGSLEDGGN